MRFPIFPSAGENMVADDGEDRLGVEPRVIGLLRIPVVEGAAGGIDSVCCFPGRRIGGFSRLKAVELSVVHGGKLVFLVENTA